VHYPLPWQLSFDNGIQFQKYDGDTAMTLTTDPNKVLQGIGAGRIYLDSAYKTSLDISNAATSSFTATPAQSIYLELDYKCTIPFQVGLATLLKSGDVYYEYFAGIRPHPDKWNHIYITALDFVNAQQGTKYMVIVRAGTDNGESTGEVLLDNMKVVSY
jgi:hypothetical protein